MWWDGDPNGYDKFLFHELKLKCPETLIYNIALYGRTLSDAIKNYNLSQMLDNESLMQEYAEILNKEFKDHLCVERE